MRKDTKHIFRKQMIAFYDHMIQMSTEKLTNIIVAYFVNKKTQRGWFPEVEKDLYKVRNQSFQGMPNLKMGKTWTEEGMKHTKNECRDFGQRIKRKEENR